MSIHRRNTVWAFPSAMIIAGTLAACSGRDHLIQPPVLSPLAGLSESPPRDSTGSVPPTPGGTTTPGDISGTVLGPSPVGAGGDTLATAPRVVGAEVTVYPMLQEGSPHPEVGPAIATTTTDANGRFAFTALPGGPVVVTVEPPASGPYAGTWSTSVIHAGSGDHPWWMVLPTK
jgi:hypothetical protein